MRGAVRHGPSILAGLLRCGHCGRKLHVNYCGTHRNVIRCVCKGGALNHGGPSCISFGGLKMERLFEEESLRRLQPLCMQAALIAIDRQMQSGDERIRQKELSVEQARFESARARRQYDAVDPDNRLVSAELEHRWNEALKKQRVLEQELKELQGNRPEPLSDVAREKIMALGADVEALWHHPGSSIQLKKRIVRVVINEIVVNKDGERISMLVHWKGGDHTALTAALITVGAADMVSVNIRSSPVQLATPDALRGRVSAVNMLFVSTSSELGAFESSLRDCGCGCSRR